jgi:microcystin-dependent protein
MQAQQLSRNTLPDTAATSGSAPYVLGVGASGGTPSWVSQTASAIGDGSITPAKLSAGAPNWDTSGNLTATSFVGPLTGDVTGAASDIEDGVVTTAKIADGAVTSAKLNSSVILVPTGAVMPFAMNSAPSGWLAANGATVSRSVYSALFTAIGTIYGTGDGSTTFTLPDLRGYFVRGAGTNADGVAGGAFGVKQADSIVAHTHNDATYTFTSAAAVTNAYSVFASAGFVNGVTGTNPARAVNAPHNGGTETRPYNIAMLYCIKF